MSGMVVLNMHCSFYSGVNIILRVSSCIPYLILSEDCVYRKVVVIHDGGSAQTMVDTELPSSLAKLNVPSGFARFDSIIEPEVIARLKEWKSNASHVLSELRTLLEKASELSLDQQADIISSVVPLASDGTWVTPDSRQTAQGARCSTFLRSDVAEIIHRYHVAIPTSRCSVTEAHLAQKRQALVLSQSTSPSQHIHWAQAGSTCRRTRGHIRLLRRPSLEREPRFSVRRGIRSEPSSGMLFKAHGHGLC